MGFHFKVYQQEKDVLIAACDDEVYGQAFEEGKFLLDVKRDFYGEESAEWEYLHSLLADASILNLVGVELISKAIEAGFIDAESVLKVRGVPHAQMVRI